MKDENQNRQYMVHYEPRASGAIHLGAKTMNSQQRRIAMQKDGETQAVDRSQDAVVGLLPIALIPIPPAIFAANAKAVEEGHLTIGHGIVTALFLLAVIAATTIAILIVRWSLNLANKANPSRLGTNHAEDQA